MSYITIQNLSLIYSHKALFENFSGKILPEQHISLSGHNGSGKTSLLEIIAGLKQLSFGHIQIPSHWIISYIPQNIVAYPKLITP